MYVLYHVLALSMAEEGIDPLKLELQKDVESLCMLGFKPSSLSYIKPVLLTPDISPAIGQKRLEASFCSFYSTPLSTLVEAASVSKHSKAVP